MIRKIIRKYRQNSFFKKTESWLSAKPVDRTVMNETSLPYPSVSQPSPSFLSGDIPEFPSYIAIEVTNMCNLKCKHCNYRYGLEHYTRDRGYISEQLMNKALVEAKEYKASVLMNYDGEPLMHKDFLKYLMMATDLNINSYFNTNGTLFSKDFSDQLTTFYKGSIFFSIDGSKSWFEKIRVPAKYDVVFNNIDYFLRVNEKRGWPITVGISLCNFGQSREERRIFLDEWMPKVNYVSMGEVNDKFGTMISEPMTLLKVRKRPICNVPWQTLGICHNGDVIPCSIYVTRANTVNAIFGNIVNQSIRDVWHGEQFAEFRKMVAEQRYSESFCDHCERWLCQFSFPDVMEGAIKVSRNGFWTTFHNTERGNLNFL